MAHKPSSEYNTSASYGRPESSWNKGRKNMCRNGLASDSTDDPQTASELGQPAAQRAHVGHDIIRIERQLDQKMTGVTPAKVEAFGKLLLEKLRSPQNPEFRRQNIRLRVGRVEASDTQIRITSQKNAVLEAITTEAAA